MTEKLQIYKCEVCGNIVEVLHEGKGELVCCGKPMTLMREKKYEEGKEKHLPIIEATDLGAKIKVGPIPHPMEEKHYIEWVEIETDAKVYRKFLSPGDAPEAEFPVKAEKAKSVREYCNIHGLWKVDF